MYHGSISIRGAPTFCWEVIDLQMRISPRRKIYFPGRDLVLGSARTRDGQDSVLLYGIRVGMVVFSFGYISLSCQSIRQQAENNLISDNKAFRLVIVFTFYM